MTSKFLLKMLGEHNYVGGRISISVVDVVVVVVVVSSSTCVPVVVFIEVLEIVGSSRQ